jgi:putative addiction module component (TIGR02574 family)
MIMERIPELQNLSSEEKVILVTELWNDLEARAEAFPVCESHVRLLEERLEHFRKFPDDVVPWETVKARLLAAR